MPIFHLRLTQVPTLSMFLFLLVMLNQPNFATCTKTQDYTFNKTNQYNILGFVLTKPIQLQFLVNDYAEQTQSGGGGGGQSRSENSTLNLFKLEIVNSVINKGKLADIPELVINAFNETLCKIKPNKQGNQPFRTNKSDLGDQFSVDASDGEQLLAFSMMPGSDQPYIYYPKNQAGAGIKQEESRSMDTIKGQFQKKQVQQKNTNNKQINIRNSVTNNRINI